jgi:hypothetical protein
MLRLKKGATGAVAAPKLSTQMSGPERGATAAVAAPKLSIQMLRHKRGVQQQWQLQRCQLKCMLRLKRGATAAVAAPKLTTQILGHQIITAVLLGFKAVD